MKVKLNDTDQGSYLTLTPENMEEVAALVRMAKSAKKEVPSVSVYFPKDGDINASIGFRKIGTSKQENYISLKKR